MKNEDGSRDERVKAENWFETILRCHRRDNLGYKVLISNANFAKSSWNVPNCNDPQAYQISFVRTQGFEQNAQNKFRGQVSLL